MLSPAGFNDLLKHQQELQSRLEANPDYRELQAVTLIIENHTKTRIVKPAASSTSERRGLKTTQEQRDKMVAAGKRYAVSIRNVPVQVKQIVTAIQEKGAEIPGKNPGTTYGAIISKHKDYELVDRKLGLWRITSEAYSATQKEMAQPMANAA